ncbi:MAG: type II secretion system protein, partial [Verrucomicrobiota bacterium]
MPTPNQVRRGFSLIETLVVLTIVAGLFALAAPAILSISSTSLRTGTQQV